LHFSLGHVSAAPITPDLGRTVSVRRNVQDQGI
jgi:hypothetical protein